MTILVYGEQAIRTHENQMLHAFLHRLEPRWGTSTDWIIVIANALWNGAEIDLVCILPSAILVADFKSHCGKLTGTENGPWQADGVLVKGGRKDNPYQQLRDNKFSALNWLQSKSLLSGRNLGHISAGVVFGERVDDHLDLSPKVRSWFYPTDLDNCAALLGRLASPELLIDRKEALDIVHRLGVRPIEWTYRRPQVRDLDQPPAMPQAPTPLTGHQRDALQALSSFANSDELITFSVLGMTSTGKTRLLIEAASEIEKAGKTPIILSPNGRLAMHAPVEAESIYAHLYAGNENKEKEEAASEEKGELDVIPLRLCTDDKDCIYLLDDAHLLGNSQFTTPDGKQYGSGHLLDDFHAFTELGKSSRKAIFFGDPYQIQRSGDDDSALLGAFQKKRELKHQSLELNQVLDTTGGSAKLANAERLVKAIRSERFAELELLKDESFRQADGRAAATEMLDRYRSDPFSVWYLAETHAKVNVLTKWVRERLHGTKFIASLMVGDLLEIYVTPASKSADSNNLFDSFAPSGSRRSTASVGDRKPYEQSLKGRDNPIRFHSIPCDLSDTERRSLDLLEDFLIAERPELSADTSIAERVLRASRERIDPKKLPRKLKKLNKDVFTDEWIRDNRPLILAQSVSNGTFSKFRNQQQSKDPTSAFKNLIELAKQQDPPMPPFAYVRYGYASTVHHAQGMSQSICYVNCDHAAGRHSEGFFRWLYSAFTVAERELVLLNFTDIHSFDSAVWNANAVAVASNIPVGAGWSFQPNGIASEKDQQRSLPPGLEQSKDVLKSVAIWLRIANAVEASGWQVAKVACHPYQEQYDLVSPQGEQSRLRIAYNDKNVITAMHINDSVHWSLLADLASGCLEANEYSPEAEGLLRSARSRLGRSGWKIVSAIETAYRLHITVAHGYDERVSVEINFDKQGLVSSVRPLHISDLGLLAEIKEALL
ncbi:MAG: NERD domain-containing protein [Porticoccaceae bacterium]